MARKGDGIYLRGKAWWLDFTHQGTRHQLGLGKSISRSAAAEIATVKRASILKGELGIGQKRKDTPFDKAKDLFLSWIEANKKPNTARSCKTHMKQLSASFGGKTLGQITPFLIEKHKMRRLQEGKPVALNRELAYLKLLFNRCKAWKKYQGDNPVVEVKKVKESEGRTRALDQDEEARLLGAAREPLRTLIILGISTGLRIQAEALTLKWQSVDLERGYLTVDGAYAKNNETVTIPINSRAVEALRQLPRKAEYVFTNRKGQPLGSIRTTFTTACKNANLLGVTPHVLRHTFASRLGDAGVSDGTIQALGRWKEPKMVMRYKHLTEKHLREAVEKIGQNSPTIFTTPAEGETRKSLCARSSVG